ncbi:hypothetical protein [Poseidonocella sedimentorum]|uniref:Uncharacterized protein n=1 Tax=Poseidonocella sedimentorum TaxID=871652 RepID=A0A1I6DUE7_9RHOB|nr:hypothetical protein [Poseidonocella sedimentorum]SFR08982.1 hypothetical protein SAMN04515673_105161 [Poseidonocella sedimentorum]
MFGIFARTFNVATLSDVRHPRPEDRWPERRWLEEDLTHPAGTRRTPVRRD